MSELAPGDDGTEPNTPFPRRELPWLLCSWGEGTGRVLTLPTSFYDPVPGLREI